MSTGYCMDVVNHYIVLLKLISYCMLTDWNSDKNLKKYNFMLDLHRLK